jgi:hypothetical protein
MAKRLIRNHVERFLPIPLDVLSAESPHLATVSILQFAISNRVQSLVTRTKRHLFGPEEAGRGVGGRWNCIRTNQPRDEQDWRLETPEIRNDNHGVGDAWSVRFPLRLTLVIRDKLID